MRDTARLPRFLVALLITLSLANVSGVAAEKRLLWGDTHLHTSYSSDAFANNNLRADPDTAFRYASGQPVVHPYHQARVQIKRPLDFLAVSDHAEFLGVIRHAYFNGALADDLGLLDRLKAQTGAAYLRYKINQREARDLFFEALPLSEDPSRAAAAQLPKNDLKVGWLGRMDTVEVDTWKTITDIADRYYRPGEFTTLIAWEWSATPGGANLHRIVLSDADASRAQRFEPWGLDDSPYPEDLWDFLERTSRDSGVTFVSVPHNSNISKGMMFGETSLRGEPLTASYARKRMRWEPIAEVTQIKGDSETHPGLSPDDPFADHETYPYYIQQSLEPYTPKRGEYLRSALRRGLELEARLGINPFQLGLIGSTDSHTALSSAEEDNFHGKMATDSIPANKTTGFNAGGGTSGWAMSASGLAAVWAEDNTREEIIAAMQRREVYASTGPRIGLRVRGGWDLAVPSEASAAQLEVALSGAVPMGAVLPAAATSSTPGFYVEAVHDPASAQLDRVQIIKGWIDRDGTSREKIHDVALSDESRRLPDGGVRAVVDTVDRKTGRVDNREGAPALSTLWEDPDFDPLQPAFYYVRVLQIPTARHSLLDALALGLEHAEGQPDTIQERAYSSPIWYRPANQLMVMETGEQQ